MKVIKEIQKGQLKKKTIKVRVLNIGRTCSNTLKPDFCLFFYNERIVITKMF